jgi:hypothetical protein
MKAHQRARSVIAGILLLSLTGPAVAALARRPANVPLPPRRPAEFVAPKPATPGELPEAAATPAPSGDDAEACTAVLASGTIAADRSPTLRAGLCGVQNPIMLKSILLPDEHEVKLEPPVAMRCRLAAAIAAWVIDDMAPAVAAEGNPLTALSGVGAYECRGRNGVAGAKLSEHAIGNALDIAALKLADGHLISIQQNDRPALLEKLRASACARFATVLGPGADASHKTHLHVDLQERKHGTKICQWDIPGLKPTETAEKKK